MAEENIRTTLQFQADITDFKSAMQEANRAVKLANSEFKAASSGMDDWSGSTDGLAAKLRQLGDVHDAEKRKLDVLQAAYQQTVREQGAASAAAVDLQTKINNQQAVVNKTEKELDAYAARLEEVERGADGAASTSKRRATLPRKQATMRRKAPKGGRRLSRLLQTLSRMQSKEPLTPLQTSRRIPANIAATWRNSRRMPRIPARTWAR